jgi:hypothetical protein
MAVESEKGTAHGLSRWIVSARIAEHLNPVRHPGGDGRNMRKNLTAKNAAAAEKIVTARASVRVFWRSLRLTALVAFCAS